MPSCRLYDSTFSLQQRLANLSTKRRRVSFCRKMRLPIGLRLLLGNTKGDRRGNILGSLAARCKLQGNRSDARRDKEQNTSMFATAIDAISWNKLAKRIHGI